jgi:hypothetical protein
MSQPEPRERPPEDDRDTTRSATPSPPPRRAVEPPDVPAAIGRVVYYGRVGAVVRFTAEMLGTDLMAAYPWSPEHGWTASN